LFPLGTSDYKKAIITKVKAHYSLSWFDWFIWWINPWSYSFEPYETVYKILCYRELEEIFNKIVPSHTQGFDFKNILTLLSALEIYYASYLARKTFFNRLFQENSMALHEAIEKQFENIIQELQKGYVYFVESILERRDSLENLDNQIGFFLGDIKRTLAPLKACMKEEEDISVFLKLSRRWEVIASLLVGLLNQEKEPQKRGYITEPLQKQITLYMDKGKKIEAISNNALLKPKKKLQELKKVNPAAIKISAFQEISIRIEEKHIGKPKEGDEEKRAIERSCRILKTANAQLNEHKQFLEQQLQQAKALVLIEDGHYEGFKGFLENQSQLFKQKVLEDLFQLKKPTTEALESIMDSHYHALFSRDLFKQKKNYQVLPEIWQKVLYIETRERLKAWQTLLLECVSDSFLDNFAFFSNSKATSPWIQEISAVFSEFKKYKFDSDKALIPQKPHDIASIQMEAYLACEDATEDSLRLAFREIWRAKQDGEQWLSQHANFNLRITEDEISSNEAQKAITLHKQEVGKRRNKNLPMSSRAPQSVLPPFPIEETKAAWKTGIN
jgi:hypothetical protein